MVELHNEKENQDAVHKISEIKERKINLWLHLLKLVCDLVPAVELSDVLFKWTNMRIPEFWMGVAGLLSGMLTTSYPRLDKDYWECTLNKI